MHTLDETDRAIIALLNEDGRMTSAEIARRLGNISARMVSYRIDGLVAKGIITVRAVVNPDVLGFDVLADVLIETEPGQLRAVAYEIAAFPQVTYVRRTQTHLLPLKIKDMDTWLPPGDNWNPA